MSLNRAASRVTPALLRGPPRALRRAPRAHREIPAIAILIPRRFESTDTATSGGGHNFPPPGFNAEQAKKPLPREQQQTASKDKSVSSAKDESSAKDAEKPDSVKNVKVPRDGPTSTAKTTAAEERSLSELAAEKAAADKADEKKVAEKKKEEKKLTIWQKVKKEVAHYWDGTKLLATEVRISSKLALKMAAGYELTRRENRQVQGISAYLERALADPV